MPTILSFLNCKYLDVENCRRNVINTFYNICSFCACRECERGGECVCISLCVSVSDRMHVCVSKILSLCVGIECVCVCVCNSHCKMHSTA